ncbi:Transketolase, thiamine diphosphate binding domain-containing protein [Desarmillaria tabescens]|uniref:Transketolase, thiamine diphosphate binding domain-containing protein n=1 Tax=Armillaria tabescens TaxID=1929756 RepID=A0AA39JIE9_ARMTA|nr:Transketolase, thiamine diphosphate binding domain-containing protein [Desarmillaria tabescens]KAK0442530.1 Transketolase, thiamine diphosphate binding domain-containing protein [Desarmillaria tabescens]
MDPTEKLVQFKGGHPGTAMGAALIGVALWRHTMRFNPKNPEWFNRDRFVLSAGHACLWQYIHLHLAGYEVWGMDALKGYHNPDFEIAAGHPEIEFPGVEVTTGLLGQGVANAHLGAVYNRPEVAVVDNRVYCLVSDGCLQEGVGQEALSLAAHLKLDNLTVIYDDNSVTVDGSIDHCFTDDTSAKMKANGFHVLEVMDGDNDLHGIISALDTAKTIKDKPTFIHIRTTIGYSSRKANAGSAHGAMLGVTEVTYVKQQFGFDVDKRFVVPQEIYDYFASLTELGAEYESTWNELFHTTYARLNSRVYAKEAPTFDASLLPPKNELPKAPQATRKSSHIVVSTFAPWYKTLMLASADLMESTFVHWQKNFGLTFSQPSTSLGTCAGRQIRYGIREFAMISVANGLNAYQNGMIIPVCSSYFQFWLYAASGLRMSGLQGLRFIGIGTHDSIGVGEDGPTHQSIALGTFFRALPNCNLLRPADVEEVLGCWLLALSPSSSHTPTIMCLTRQAVPHLDGTDRSKVEKGAYVVWESHEGTVPEITLIGTGSEVALCLRVGELLAPRRVRVVSMPSQDHFIRQMKAYRDDLLGVGEALVVAVEAWGSYAWARWAHASVSMHTFGLSAPQETLYEILGFGPQTVADKIGDLVSRRTGRDGVIELPEMGEFEELLVGYAKMHAGPHNI